MTATERALHLATERDFENTRPPVPDVTEVAAAPAPAVRTSRLAPPSFVALREGGLEPMNGTTTREQALETIHRQVRMSGKVGNIVYVYALVAAVEFEPSSSELSPDDIAAKFAKPANANDPE